jgi:amino acid adenylation domain-containing protein
LNASDLQTYLASLNVEISADDGRLRVNAPRGTLTAELRQTIEAHKAELLETLARRTGGRGAALTRISRDGPLQLSFFQERLWVLHRLDPASVAYNMAAVWLSPGSVETAHLEHAIRDVAERHEILRATFHAEEDRPQIRLLPAGSTTVEISDLRTQTEAQQRETINAAVDAATAKPFDLSAEAPVRFTLYQLASGKAALLVAAHHIALDAWSMTLLRRDIMASYECPARDEPPGRQVSFQYADYAAWQRRNLDARAIASDLDWWERNLAGIPPLCAFPADRLPATGASGSSRFFRWDAELSSGIRSMVRGEGATIYMALLAACAVVLRAHTGQGDIVLGSPTGVRERPEFETVIGPFVDLLVLRVDLADDPTFAELLARCRDAVLDAHAHRQVPFEMLIERLKPVRSFNRSPLFQVAVVQHNATSEQAERLVGGGAIHDLTWFVRDIDDRLEGWLEYRSDLYSSETIDRIAGHLETVLRKAVDDRHRRIAALSLLTPQEREQVTGQFNATSVETDPATFVTQFERQAALTPAAVAIHSESGALTYAALNERANQIARHLRSLGVGPGILVGFCLERSLDLVAALVAIQKAGGAYLPLDPALPPERLRFMLADSGATLLVVTGGTLSGAEMSGRPRIVDLGSDAAILDATDTADLGTIAGPEDVAYVIYTSGSTGHPKGVAVSHRALSNLLGSMKREPGLSATDILAAVTTISFDIAALELYLPLIVGARVALISRDTAADGVMLAAALSASGTTIMQATPATWRLLLDADWQPRQGFRALCGGEALSRELADALLKRTPDLWNLYGPTETTIWSTAARIEPDGEPISIGRPIANTRVYVVDETGEPVPIGLPGEIWIGGAGVTLGYHRRPELSAERFVPDRFSTRSGEFLYRTGDIGRWGADGRLYHLGRIDSQVKIRGFRVEPGEIEAALCAQAAIRQAVVVARSAGPDDVRLVAYVVSRAGEELNMSDVRRQLKRQLPEYMVPSIIVGVDAMPLTANGKVDRASLPDPFKSSLGNAAGHEPPAPGIETLLAEIWRDILKIDEVGAEQNFFELGGHSLLSLRVAAAVERRTGWQMDPRALFFQNLRQVASTIGDRASVTANRSQ